MTRRIAITTLIENAPSAHRALACEWGLSFHVRTKDRAFLFDCGATDSLLANARQLRIDVSRLDFIVLSHAHFDHCGGFRAVVETSSCNRVITGEGFFEPKFAREGMRHSYIGPDFDLVYLAEKGVTHETCPELIEIDDRIWLVGGVERTFAIEQIPARFVVERDDAFIHDTFADEIFMACRFEDGLALIVGCSHPGIVNMVRTAEKRLALPVRGIWGGTHLYGADDARLDVTLEELREMGVKYFGLTHCSGDALLQRLAAEEGIECCRLSTGDGIYL